MTENTTSCTATSSIGFFEGVISKAIKGWNPNQQPVDDGVTMKNRPELLLLLYEVKSLIEKFESPVKSNAIESLAYLRRISCKLKYYLFTSNAGYYPTCSCSLPSESCVGIVPAPAINLEKIHCAFTGRVLPPVIFQSHDMLPTWLKIKQEIYNAVKVKNKPSLNSPTFIKRPLTFAHITSCHIPAIKCLLENYFWSSVDLSMILQYPEFTCVVLYRQLVVGFGFLSPGTHRNEGYVNFLFVRPHWRRCGIAELILYLLRQQCLYWSLTLHVSPNSEALNLYHKFGFKTYSRIKNFYTGYVVSYREGDRDALLMKLESKLPQVF